MKFYWFGLVVLVVGVLVRAHDSEDEASVNSVEDEDVVQVVSYLFLSWRF